MSVADKILTRASATNSLTPCPSCHSAIRWVDIYGTTRCKGCHAPPSRLYVARVETLVWWDVPGHEPAWETIWERPKADDSPPFYDPFVGRVPPGWWLPVGNRSDFGCKHPETRSVPCRDGQWVRIECVSCGRPLELRDRPKRKLVI